MKTPESILTEYSEYCEAGFLFFGILKNESTIKSSFRDFDSFFYAVSAKAEEQIEYFIENKTFEDSADDSEMPEFLRSGLKENFASFIIFFISSDSSIKVYWKVSKKFHIYTLRYAISKFLEENVLVSEEEEG